MVLSAVKAAALKAAYVVVTLWTCLTSIPGWLTVSPVPLPAVSGAESGKGGWIVTPCPYTEEPQHRTRRQASTERFT